MSKVRAAATASDARASSISSRTSGPATAGSPGSTENCRRRLSIAARLASVYRGGSSGGLAGSTSKLMQNRPTISSHRLSAVRCPTTGAKRRAARSYAASTRRASSRIASGAGCACWLTSSINARTPVAMRYLAVGADLATRFRDYASRITEAMYGSSAGRRFDDRGSAPRSNCIRALSRTLGTRKTAAAAYRRLQMEGLVRVRPRSGVYLRGSEPERTGGPLERLHRRWLENAYEGARAIGLDTSTMLKLIQAVALIEKQRIPVLEHDGAQAEAIALEIAERLGVNAVPVQLQDVDPSDPLIATAPFLVTTPYQGANVRRIAGSRQVVEVSCAREVVEELRQHATSGRLLIVAPTADATERVRRAIEHGEV